MDEKGFVVASGRGPVWDMSPGRSATLKLQSEETAESVMMFEEVAPTGTATAFHIHHNSDEVAYVLAEKSPLRSVIRSPSAGPARALSYRAALRMPGRAPEPKPEESSSSLRQRRQESGLRSGNDCSARLRR
ncbi:MAG TPA: hypothetical protein VHT21_18975 [Stellaceae bacterium]|nr:hypothetical protein [Stellaceae bacterium]